MKNNTEQLMSPSSKYFQNIFLISTIFYLLLIFLFLPWNVRLLKTLYMCLFIDHNGQCRNEQICFASLELYFGTKLQFPTQLCWSYFPLHVLFALQTTKWSSVWISEHRKYARDLSYIQNATQNHRNWCWILLICSKQPRWRRHHRS